MEKETHLHHLMERIRDLEMRVDADKQRLETGSATDKVKAAGDLALVERRLERLKAKFKRAQEEPEGFWESVKDELDEDVGSIETAFSRWADKNSGI